MVKLSKHWFSSAKRGTEEMQTYRIYMHKSEHAHTCTKMNMHTCTVSQLTYLNAHGEIKTN